MVSHERVGERNRGDCVVGTSYHPVALKMKNMTNLLSGLAWPSDSTTISAVLKRRASPCKTDPD